MTYREYLDYYTVLNIEPGASKEQIKLAYISLAKQYHPDRFQTDTEKRDAEFKFKQIAEAYEELKSVDENYNEFVSSNSFSSSFDEDYSEINDMPSDSAAFFKFYFSQQEINEKQTQKEKPKTRNNQKTKKQPTDDFKTQAIKTFEKYIKDNELNLLYVYECIRTNQTIINSIDKIDDAESYNSLLVKEILYRRYIKSSKEYELYTNKHSYFKNIDLSGVLHVDITYPKKKFDEEVIYKVKKICSDCNGVGCEKCKRGYVEHEHTVHIKVPYVSRSSLFFEIKDGGNQSPIGNGKLFLQVFFSKVKLKDAGYQFNLQKKMQLSLEPILQAADWMWVQLKAFYHIIMENKHLSSLYFIIGLLLITIICLAVLL